MFQQHNSNLPVGFAEQVMDLQIKLEQEESLEVIQILIQMYRIAVDFYIDQDIKKASYFQKKLNALIAKSINATSIQQKVGPKDQFSKKIKIQVDKFVQQQKIVLKTMLENTQKSQKRLNETIKMDLQKQEQKFQRRMMKRAKSTGKF